MDTSLFHEPEDGETVIEREDHGDYAEDAGQLVRFCVLAVKLNGAVEVCWPLHETREAAKIDARRSERLVKGIVIEVGKCVVTRGE